MLKLFFKHSEQQHKKKPAKMIDGSEFIHSYYSFFFHLFFLWPPNHEKEMGFADTFLRKKKYKIIRLILIKKISWGMHLAFGMEI